MTYTRVSAPGFRLSLLLHGLSLCVLLLLGLSNVYSQAPSRVQTGRPLSLDDLFNLRQTGRYYGGPIAFSPDGRQLAFVIQRPKRMAELCNTYLWGNDRADVYVVSLSGGQPVNITNGVIDGAGYWAPGWSPDGKRLAMLSTRGGNVHLWVWEQASGSLRKVTDRGVQLYSTIDRPYAWISAARLLVPVLPPGVKPEPLINEIRTANQMSDVRPMNLKDDVVSVSVLTSGVKPDINKRRQGELLAIDANTGKSRVVTSGAVRNIVISPDRQAVAYVRQVEIFQPEAGKPLPSDVSLATGRFELEVMSIEGASLFPRDPIGYDVVPKSLRWAPDSAELAFLTYTKNKREAPLLVRFSKSNHTLRAVRTDDLDLDPVSRQAPQLEWTREGWLTLASKLNQAAASRSHVRRDWWLVGEKSSPYCVTDSLATVPAKLWREAGRDSYIGLAEGKLWRIGVEAPPQILIAGFQPRISGIVWPQEPQTGDVETPVPSATYHRVLVSAQATEQQELFAVDLASGQVTKMSKPVPNANITSVSPVNWATVYSLSDHTGLRLWIANTLGAQPSVIFEANTFLREVAAGAHQKIEYKSLDGKDLSGWLILPPGYQRGIRYPLLVWVYPGWVARPSPSGIGDISFVSSLNLQIPAARGYAVLSPSVPVSPVGNVDDLMLKLTASVLPSVDKAIELGIADPGRIFAMGHSNGGYAIYGLVTQTHRFKAAVAMAGYSNLISGYSQFNAATQYGDYPHEILTRTQQVTIEIALRLGSSPWEDLGRYLRNSPIFHVGRVETPLLIIHGDMDGVPIEQAEEFFMALYRQRKRAELVRYWGEGHVIESPANIRDMWNRIFTWFEEFSQMPRQQPVSNMQK